MKYLPYTIVIATRNRPAALRLSIPRMLSQSRPPRQLVVVDSSDDHAATVDAVRESVGNHPLELMILPSERGLTRQRNLALGLVRNPVVFFPDDDSIWFPGVAAAILDVYERDFEMKIAGVCGAESGSPPPDWELAHQATYQMRPSHRIQQRFAAFRARVENRIVPDPALILGRSFWPAPTSLPNWFGELDVVPVEWMTGFRMSFRTDVIQRVRFDETLARYSLFEDIDASFGAWSLGWVVGARRALIYHYRSPENRDHGRQLGVGQIVNKAYLIGKHASHDHPSRNGMVKFGRYKAFQYLLASHGEFGKQRHRGALAALKEVEGIAQSPPDRVAEVYRAALARSLVS